MITQTRTNRTIFKFLAINNTKHSVVTRPCKPLIIFILSIDLFLIEGLMNPIRTYFSTICEKKKITNKCMFKKSYNVVDVREHLQTLITI